MGSRGQGGGTLRECEIIPGRRKKNSMDDHCNNYFHRVLCGGTNVGTRERGGGEGG